MEAGAKTFLIDEDSSAVNFLIRDVRVRKLLGDDREPLIPLTDRIREISAQGYSFILVAGGEPMIRRDVMQAAATMPNIIFPIFTNGTFIDDEYFQLLDKNQVYAQEADFEFVADFLKQHCKNAKISD